MRRFARNPRIARVMSDLAYGQELGEGLRRMVSVMESRGLRRPTIRQTAGGTDITMSGALDVLSAISTLSPSGAPDLRVTRSRRQPSHRGAG